MHGMPIPSRKRCLELGAAFIEADLDSMRRQARQHHEDLRDFAERHPEAPRGNEPPITTSQEGDLMKAVEWATAAATLRAMAAQED